MQISLRILRVLLVVALPLTFSGCGIINGLLRTAMGLAGPALQYKIIFNCIPEGTEVDTPNGARPIESLKPGDIVIGYTGERVRVMQKHEYLEENSEGRFLSIEFESGAIVHTCDMHKIDGERAKNLQVGAKVGRDLVKEVRSYPGEVVRSYDLLTEDKGYQVSGIPVNSMIEEMDDAIRRRLSVRQIEAQSNTVE